MSQAVMSIGFNGQEIGLMTKHKFYVSMAKVILSISLSLLMGVSLIAQDKRTLKDSLDGAFDLSDWVLTAHGFIPVPMLITEPALGGFGGALMAVFITRNAPYVDTVDGKPVKQRVKPNVYGL